MTQVIAILPSTYTDILSDVRILPLLSFSTVYSATLRYTVSCDNHAVTRFNPRLYCSVHFISTISHMGWSRIHQILPWRSLLPWYCCHGNIGWVINEATAGYVEFYTTMYAVSLSLDACKRRGGVPSVRRRKPYRNVSIPTQVMVSGRLVGRNSQSHCLTSLMY